MHWKLAVIMLAVAMIIGSWAGFMTVVATDTPPEVPPGEPGPETGEEHSNETGGSETGEEYSEGASDSGEQPEETPDGQPEETPDSQPDGEDSDGGPPEETPDGAETGKKMREQAMKIAEQCKLFGQFTYDAGSVSGRFVEFYIDNVTGTISDYTIKRPTGSIEIFETVTIAEFTPEDEPRVEGSVFIFDELNVRIRAHNNPPAVLHYAGINEPNFVTLTLAQDLSATIKTNNTVAISGEEFDAILVTGNSEIDISGSTIEVNLSVSASVLFRAIPKLGASIWRENQDKICDAIGDGKIGAELSVVARDGTWVEDHIPYQDVQMRTTGAEKGRVEIEVTADLEEGKVVVINVDLESLDIASTTELEVLYDDIELDNVQSIDALLEGTEAAYYVTVSEVGVQVLVSIPSFSTHTITIQKTEVIKDKKAPTIGFMTMLIVIAAIATVAILAFASVRKKR
jgi:hypothetical protein